MSWVDNDVEFWKKMTPEKLQKCLDEGEDVLAKNKEDYTPLHLLAERNENSLLIYILGQHKKSTIKRDDFVHARDQFGHTPIHRAAVMNKNPEVFIELILLGADVNVLNDHDSTPLHLAAELGTPESILYLIALGADLNAKDKEGYTPQFCVRENQNLYYGEKAQRAKRALSDKTFLNSDK